MPTFGLLAGTINVYGPQFAPVTIIELQELVVCSSTEILVVEPGKTGIATCSVPPPTATCCCAVTAASIVAGFAPLMAVMAPCRVAGPMLGPVSACNGMLPRFVPPGTFSKIVAL